MRDLDLPRGDEREQIVDRDRVCELDGEDSRTLAVVGAFRIMPEHDLDLPHDTLENLHEQRLVELADLGYSERGLTRQRGGTWSIRTRWSETTSRRRCSTLASAAYRKSTTTRISTQRFGRRRPVLETSTLISRSDASSSSKT